MRGAKATQQTGNKYEILKRDLRIHIELIKNHVTIAILRREDAPGQQNVEKSGRKGDENQVPDSLVLN
ncbi:hypothetical protein L596_001477 [Steinernema carpocapsae]|uniref:Uncharacterized protein n=1 Tax=Steinernema carpocapsae TaxID=34508 RepID=A0A4U8UL67_STECR|nr:hypothetical protein L596_001477 [Steinernema carpocapsae]